MWELFELVSGDPALLAQYQAYINTLDYILCGLSRVLETAFLLWLSRSIRVVTRLLFRLIVTIPLVLITATFLALNR